ncbi:hypothetical protein FIV42_23590 [Persicimonas caeni]|uniref:Uncharacterized protein n=1 Tax=Persicimonas caeni TaxID=2292766 RepID=A0A4Y6PZ73_PERCE|nr:hypothetical protein [Persicimonas caeni]QDG53618.1 hypothetical protein FIV42_23590 [Persicimonas caeni]QED34839.1 hypothetical protein FRD00_23585 [Persicimonas caeni]
MLKRMTHTKQTKRSLGTLASLGLLAAGVLGAACGDVGPQDIDSAAPATTVTTTHSLSDAPVTDHLDEAGNYFLICHTGADIPPISVTPSADLASWMRTCMDGVLGQSGPGATDEEITECRRDVMRHFFHMNQDPEWQQDTPLKEGDPYTGMWIDSNYWVTCNTGADIDHFNVTDHVMVEFYEWRDKCLAGASGGTGGPGVGVVHPRLHRDMGSRTEGSRGTSRRSSIANPICQGLMGERIDTHTPGLVYGCSSTKRVSKGGMSRDEFRMFAQDCKDNGNGFPRELPFAPGKDINRDMIYICSTTGRTVQHKDGYQALKSLSGECRENGGNVLYRSFDDPEVGDYIKYLCSSTGETLPHSDGQGAFEAFALDCLQRGGTVLSNVDYAYADVEPVEPIGRDGREDTDNTEKGRVINANDTDGNEILVCFPGKPGQDWISADAPHQDVLDFEEDCKNAGSTVISWGLYPRASVTREER